jgi:ornithine carbamoyltransferase
MKKDLLKLLDLSREDIMKILNTGDQMKYNQKHRLNHNYLQGQTLAMIFEKNSTRTRVSFETGMYQLGGHALFLSGKESQIGRGEPIQDTARVLARYCDGIMIRTYGQEEVEELAKYASIPVINGLTDFAHPCQVLADLMTVREKMTRLEGLKLCFIGDGNNMANSLIVGGLKCGMEVAVATPKGYEPDGQVLSFAREEVSKGAKFTLTTQPMEAAEKADVVITDVWASMGQEEEAQKRREAFQGFQVNRALMSLTNPGCMVQHCLPAHREEEITAEIFEEHANEIFEEAENRLHAQKAVMYLLMGQDV